MSATAGKVLGYALIQRDANGQPHMDFYGSLFATPQEAMDDPASQVSDAVVAVCEVPS
jgi:hypothetical protein